MLINFKEAFTFMFKDEKFWQKYLIGTAFGIIPFTAMGILMHQYGKLSNSPQIGEILGLLGLFLITSLGGILLFFSIGFGVKYANAKIAIGTNELPEWGGNFKNIFIDGIKLWAGMLLISACGGLIISVFQFIINIIAGIIGIVLGFNGASKEEISSIIVILGAVLIVFTVIIYSIFIIFMYLSMSSFLVDKNVLAVFNFKRIWSLLKGNFLNLILIFLIFVPFYVFSLLIFLLPIICSVVLIITNFYIMMVLYNLLAQYVQIGTKKNQERLEAKKLQENISEN